MLFLEHNFMIYYIMVMIIPNLYYVNQHLFNNLLVELHKIKVTRRALRSQQKRPYNLCIIFLLGAKRPLRVTFVLCNSNLLDLNR